LIVYALQNYNNYQKNEQIILKNVGYSAEKA